tara:strand:+ start:503 stop:2347 length:1845 start_codon:yes stop_codon:yes gene_type:complete
MKHTLNILTRCTRPINLVKVKESVFTDIPKNLKIKWHVIFDVAPLKDIDAELLSKLTNEDTQLYFIKGGDGGLLYPQSTEILKKMNKESWFYFLDDDNILHENFYKRMSNILDEKGKNIHVVSQKVAGKDFTRLDIRVASPENTGFRKTDIAQVVIKTSLIHKYEFGANYAADGYFIEAVLQDAPSTFSYHNEILSYYNYLDKEATPKLPRVLYIGKERPRLVTSKVLDYEANELTVKYLEDDEDVVRVIAEFKPDSIITVGESFKSFPNLGALPLQFRRKWINIDNEEDLKKVGDIAYGVSEQAMLDPTNMNDESLISFFTPIYNTKEKLYETYESVARQTYSNWEWVLMNDSTDGGRTLKIAEDIAKNDPRVKVYDLREKSGGCIGEVKWRACAMARGYIVAELDHDDLLAENCAMDLHNAAQAHPECGFFYGDTAEVNEEWENNKYEPGFALGYGNYRDEEYKGKMLSPANQQNINPKTIRHIVGVPNHIRAWRRTTYFEIGGHNRSLTVVDDYELIVRTFLNTIMCKIPKLSYIQFLYNNAGGRNTHDLSRADIQRRTRTIAAHYNEQIKARFEELGQHDWAYEEAPHYPIHSASRYGKEEGYVNVIFKG